jgi:WD40 repeat protein
MRKLILFICIFAAIAVVCSLYFSEAPQVPIIREPQEQEKPLTVQELKKVVSFYVSRLESCTDKEKKKFTRELRKLVKKCVENRETLLLYLENLAFEARNTGVEKILVRIVDINRRPWLHFKRLRLLEAKKGWVFSVAFSPDGKYLACGDRDGTICVWDKRASKLLHTFRNRKDPVHSVAFSPDSELVASAHYDGAVSLWYLGSGKCVRTFGAGRDGKPVSSAPPEILQYRVAFSPDGKFIATAGWAGKIRIWNADTGECLRTIEGDKRGVYSISFSPDSRLLASGGCDKTVRIWNPRDGESINSFAGHGDCILSVQFSSNRCVMASAGVDDTIRIWHPYGDGCLRVLTGHRGDVWALAFSPDGSVLVSGGRDKILRVWDPYSGACLRTLKGHENWVRAVAFAPDRETLASADAYGNLIIWGVPED